jgi:hypothetical protein
MKPLPRLDGPVWLICSSYDFLFKPQRDWWVNRSLIPRLEPRMITLGAASRQQRHFTSGWDSRTLICVERQM